MDTKIQPIGIPRNSIYQLKQRVSSISFINQKGELLNAYSLPLPAKVTGMQQINPIENQASLLQLNN